MIFIYISISCLWLCCTFSTYMCVCLVFFFFLLFLYFCSWVFALSHHHHHHQDRNSSCYVQFGLDCSVHGAQPINSTTTLLSVSSWSWVSWEQRRAFIRCLLFFFSNVFSTQSKEIAWNEIFLKFYSLISCCSAWKQFFFLWSNSVKWTTNDKKKYYCHL